MDLYNQILIKVLQKQKMVVTFPELKITPAEIIEKRSYKALKRIKAIIQDESLEDKECFMKIEEIICLFKEMGCHCGSRHDFG